MENDVSSTLILENTVDSSVLFPTRRHGRRPRRSVPASLSEGGGSRRSPARRLTKGVFPALLCRQRAGLSYQSCKAHRIVTARLPRRHHSPRIEKHPEAEPRGVFLFGFVRSESGLADGVDVTGQVEHLVGEAPLVRGCLRRPRRVIPYRNAQSSRLTPFPMSFRYQVFKHCVDFVAPKKEQPFTSKSIS